jgi:3-phosphoshikimate 1-carboxyvinyltransferase
VKATVTVPGSKSITNRALICASLAKGESVIVNASDSDDTALMANGLNQLGVLVRKSGSDLVVEGTGGRFFAPKFSIPVGNAGTTLRFLIGLAAIAKGKTVFEGSARMGERPVSALIDSLHMLGVESESLDFVTRYAVVGGTLTGGVATVQSDLSSQFISSLLMIAPYAKENVRIEAEGNLVSEPYVNMTLQVMKMFGVTGIRTEKSSFLVEAGQRYKPATIEIEPDATGASYFFAAAAITHGEVVVRNARATSLQGDWRILQILKEMGCKVVEDKNGIGVRGIGMLRGMDVDLRDTPDLAPTIAITGLFAGGTTRIRNVPQLRHKESDRLNALVVELQKLGANIRLVEDGVQIEPSSLHGAPLDTYDDHRLAMSFAVAGLRVPGVRVENPECVTKSFPEFWEEFERIV